MPNKTKQPKKKSQGGRPSKFKAEFARLLTEFFAVDPYRKEVSEFSKEYYKNGTLKKESEKCRLVPNTLPTLFGFARSIGVDYTTVYRWAERGEDDTTFGPFCKAYKEAKEAQKEFLISIGLAGAAPPASFIFTAKNVTDMRDKQEVESTKTFEVTGLEKLEDSQLDELITALQNRVGHGAPRAGSPKKGEPA